MDGLTEQIQMTDEEHAIFLAESIKRNHGIHPPGGYRLVGGQHRFLVDYSDGDDRRADFRGVVTHANISIEGVGSNVG